MIITYDNKNSIISHNGRVLQLDVWGENVVKKRAIHSFRHLRAKEKMNVFVEFVFQLSTLMIKVCSEAAVEVCFLFIVRQILMQLKLKQKSGK